MRQPDDARDGRAKAAPAGADRGLEFAFGHPLEQESAGHIPANMTGRLLDDGDLRKLHRTWIKKKPPAPSVRQQTRSAGVGRDDPPQTAAGVGLAVRTVPVCLTRPGPCFREHEPEGPGLIDRI
jgi:hypothetical protein